MSSSMQALYRIEKLQDNGDETSTYRLTYKLTSGSTSETSKLVQRTRLNITKEDADGTTSTSSVDIMPSSLASLVTDKATVPTTSKANGFAVNLSYDNLAVGGTYYEIDGFVGTYSGSSSSSQTSGSFEFEGEITNSSSNSGSSEPIVGPGEIH